MPAMVRERVRGAEDRDAQRPIRRAVQDLTDHVCAVAAGCGELGGEGAEPAGLVPTPEVFEGDRTVPSDRLFEIAEQAGGL